VGGWEFFTIYCFRCERLDRLDERERGLQDAATCEKNRKCLPEFAGIREQMPRQRFEAPINKASCEKL